MRWASELLRLPILTASPISMSQNQSAPILQNDLLLRVARGETVHRAPVWMMRQAGRSLVEYKQVQVQAGGFRALIAQPALAAEVTIQPVEIVGVDAAIIFSDILVIPEAMGLPYQMLPQKGPSFEETIRSSADMARLHPVQSEGNLDHTYEALRITKRLLNGRVPLIGFAGAPWTIFCYMTEGSGSKTFSVAKSILYRNPVFAHDLLQRITDATIIYLRGQIAAGADLVQIFDSWAGALDRKTFEAFSLPYIAQICAAIQEVPKTVFAKGAFFSLDSLAALDCQVLGIDWQIDAEMATAAIKKQALQGNADPCLLYAAPEVIAQETTAMLNAFPAGRHIANLGHGINPDTPRESLFAFVETVKNHRYA